MAEVSILTGPKGPVQPSEALLSRWVETEFQSSPAPKGRCNRPIGGPWALPGWFQSSPAPKGRCNQGRCSWLLETLPVSILTGPKGPVQPGGRGTAGSA